MFHPYLLLYEGLFHQVIAQSGAESAFWAVNWPSQEPNKYAFQVAERIGCMDDDVTLMLDCMKEHNWTMVALNSNITCAVSVVIW